MRVQESRENYLEAILMLQKKLGYVRSVDVANHLNFSRPSVSVAMANLRNLGLVTGASVMGAVFASGAGAADLAGASAAAVARGMALTFGVAAALGATALVIAWRGRG